MVFLLNQQIVVSLVDNGNVELLGSNKVRLDER
jgi:hypothetical protein